MTNGNDLVILGSSNGRMCRFNENEVRIMGRTAAGVKGIELVDATCIGASICSEDDEIIIVTKNGYGKKTSISEYRQTKRGSKGVKAMSISDKNGDIASFKIYKPNTDLVLITDLGMVMRMSTDQISTLGRVTQGTRLMKIKDNSVIATVSLVDTDKEENEDINTEENTIENNTEPVDK